MTKDPAANKPIDKVIYAAKKYKERGIGALMGDPDIHSSFLFVISVVKGVEICTERTYNDSHLTSNELMKKRKRNRKQ